MAILTPSSGTVTALDIIKGALRKICQYAPGETIDADDATDALNTLNGMLDLWSNEHLMVYNNIENVLALTAGKNSYTVGAGGDLNISRPLRISGAYSRLTPTGNSVDFPCREVAFEQYAALGLKSQPGPWPKFMYYDTAYPMATLYVWPVPTQSVEFHLWTDMVFSQFASTSTAVALPQGYVLAMQTNLACLLAPEYGAQPSPELKSQARKFKQAIKDMNDTPEATASFDGALAGGNVNDAGWYLHGGFGY
jgi:hypothetical protein